MNRAQKLSIREYIKDISTLNLIFPVVVLAIIAVLLFTVPFDKIFFPEEASGVDEIKTLYEKKYPACDFVINELHYTGYDYYTKDKEAAASYYYALNTDGMPSCVFFLIPAEKTENKADVLTGYHAKAVFIKGNSRFDSFIKGFSSDVEWDSAALKEISGGFLVSEYNYNPTLYIIMAILVILIVIFCVGYMIGNIVFIAAPHMYPACTRLLRFGLERIDFKEIDSELTHSWLIKSGNFRLTDNYLVAFGKRDFWIVPLFNVVWAYKYSTRHPFSKKNKITYSLVIITSPKDKITIHGNDEKSTNMILNFLQDNYTQITIGYSDQIREKMDRLI